MNIWVPKTKILEPRRELLMPSCRLAGLFKLEAIRPDGRVRLLADWFPNLITNAGLNGIGNNANYLAAARVGTGSATPNVSDTGMNSYVAGANPAATDRIAASTPPYFGTTTIRYRFSVGDAAGNLAEVGVASQAAIGGVQFSRALILDPDGNPTTITVLSDEVLDVTYALQIIAPTSDVTDTVTIGGVDYDTVTRACAVTNVGIWSLGGSTGGGTQNTTAYSGSIGAVTASAPSGSSAPNTSSTPSSYSADSFFRESVSEFSLGTANFGGNGITALAFLLGLGSGGFGQMQLSLNSQDSPAKGIPKTSSDVLSLVTRHTWARGTAIV